MSTTPSHSMRSVTLRQGESISLVTGQVTVAPAKPTPYVTIGVQRGLTRNDLRSLVAIFRA